MEVLSCNQRASDNEVFRQPSMGFLKTRQVNWHLGGIFLTLGFSIEKKDDHDGTAF